MEINKLIVRRSLSDHYCGEMRGDPIKLNGIHRTTTSRSESHRWHADGVRVENLPRIHDVGHPRRD